MGSGQHYYLQITGSTYQIRDASGTSVKFMSGTTTITLNSGVTFGSYSNLPNGLVAFDGSGIPYVNNPTVTKLLVTANIPLQGGGVTATVSINPETGRVLVQ
jgi:hypothetical protein